MNYVGSSRSKRGGGKVKWILALVALAAVGAGVWYFYSEIREALGMSESLGDTPYDYHHDFSPPDIDGSSSDATADGRMDGMLWTALEEAVELAKADRLLEVRDKLLKLMKDSRDAGGNVEGWQEVETLLGKVNVTLMTTPRQVPGVKTVYTVQDGDTLSKIASTFVCPKPLIMKINKIVDENKIRPRDRLSVLDKPTFDIVVSKKTNTLLLNLNGEFFKRYIVGTGEYGKTPVGTFVIDDKIEEPVWWKDGKPIPFGNKEENILGTRWMNISATGDTEPVSGYGIHGTWDDASLGKQSSAGCIRMNNADVEELFMFVPRGTTVTITE